MTQSKGPPDQGAGAGTPQRSRLDGYDPRDPRHQPPQQPHPYPASPYTHPAYPQAPGQQAPYGGGLQNSNGYSYPPTEPPPTGQRAGAAPQGSSRQPQPLAPPVTAPPSAAPPQHSGAPSPHSAYQYLPQGYGQAPRPPEPQPAPARTASRQEPQFGAADLRYGRPEPAFEPQTDPRGYAREEPPSHLAPPPRTQPPRPQPALTQPPPALPPLPVRPSVQPLSQLPGYPRAAAPAAPQPPRFDPRYAQRQPYPAEPAHPAPPELRGGHFDHHAPDDPRGYGLPSQLPQRPVSHAPLAGPENPAHGAQQGYPAPYSAPYPAEAPQVWDDRHGDPSAEANEPLDEEFEEEPPRGGGRRLLMVGLLLGAIATGGGLAYAYKSYFSPPTSGTPKIVKAPTDPARVAPAEPGGRKVANGDSKLLDRLPSDGQRGEDGQIRIVTIPVNRNGQLAAPPPQAIEPRAPSSIAPAAGIVLRDTGPPGLPQSAPGASPFATAPAQPLAQPPPARAVTITNAGAAPTAPTPPAAPPVAVTIPPAQPPKRVAVTVPPPPAPAVEAEEPPPVQKPKQRASDAFSPGKAPGTPTAAATSTQKTVAVAKAPVAKAAGYVSALSSHDTKEAALRSLADLQQSYGAALAGKLLDVAPTDAATKARGFNYRVVVGPPASKAAAGTICAQLKAAGHSSCWAVPYVTE